MDRNSKMKCNATGKTIEKFKFLQEKIKQTDEDGHGLPGPRVLHACGAASPYTGGVGELGGRKLKEDTDHAAVYQKGK